MKKQGYQVTSRHPICIDFPDGRAVNYPRGERFVAHPMNASVRRALRRNDLRVVGPMEAPVKEVKLGMAPGRESRLKFNQDKRLQDRARAKKESAAREMAGGREVVSRASLQPQPTNKPDSAEK